MNALGKNESLHTIMLAMGRNAREAGPVLRDTGDALKRQALMAAANIIRDDANAILAANHLDMDAAKSAGAATPLLDRLKLDDARIAAMANGVETVAAQPDPVHRELARWQRPNGLDIARVSTPIGVIGIIYESRPNVTADAAALCLKAGNASILRAGSESFHSSQAIHAAFVRGLATAGLPSAAVQLVPTRDREAVGYMLSGLNDAIDLIVPRGGKQLVERVQAEARVPVLAHAEGICHVYVHEAAEFEMARRIVLNAKLRRTGICGAAETLLIDRAVLPSLGLAILNDLHQAGCEIRGDDEVRAVASFARVAGEEDWRTEYLDAIIAVRTVDGIEQAVQHIAMYGSHHTDAIVTEDAAVADYFLNRVDSAIVVLNASTQFADGGEFGFGGEIGIATGKLHARGPVGVEQLTTFKYVVRGTGQTRP